MVVVGMVCVGMIGGIGCTGTEYARLAPHAMDCWRAAATIGNEALTRGMAGDRARTEARAACQVILT